LKKYFLISLTLNEKGYKNDFNAQNLQKKSQKVGFQKTRWFILKKIFSHILLYVSKISLRFGVPYKHEVSYLYYRQPSLYAVFLSAILSICDHEMAFFLEPIL